MFEMEAATQSKDVQRGMLHFDQEYQPLAVSQAIVLSLAARVNFAFSPRQGSLQPSVKHSIGQVCHSKLPIVKSNTGISVTLNLPQRRRERAERVNRSVTPESTRRIKRLIINRYSPCICTVLCLRYFG